MKKLINCALCALVLCLCGCAGNAASVDVDTIAITNAKTIIAVGDSIINIDHDGTAY